ncbi:MAG: hypothetical protein NC548_45280 [Lachnospiraceae bacterium]|nr:hypothetical protein [Lachnospiraceae bacterium]
MEQNKNALYGGPWEALTVGDVERIDRMNARNNYGLSYDELRRMILKHRKARKSGDVRKMEQVEYQLTDINFHHECGLLCRGEYDKALQELEEEQEAGLSGLFPIV